MRMRTHLILLSFVLLLTACSPTPQPWDSGIEGTVTIGPMCPVMQEDVPCPGQPYQAVLTVLTTGGDEVTQFQTDEQGQFQVALALGRLCPASCSCPMDCPSCQICRLTVDEHEDTQLQNKLRQRDPLMFLR